MSWRCHLSKLQGLHMLYLLLVCASSGLLQLLTIKPKKISCFSSKAVSHDMVRDYFLSNIYYLFLKH